MLLDLLDKAGNLFDLPGSMVRDALTLNNPLDQLLTPLSSDNRMDGRDVLEKWGMLGPNTEGLDVGDVAGTAAGIALDPLTWVSGAGVMKLLGRGSKSAKAGTGTKAAQALLEAPTQSRALVPYRSPLQSVLQGPASPMTPIDSDPFAIMREAMGQPKPAALPAPAPVFYSRLRRAIEQLPDNPKGFKSQSVLNMLKKAPEGISMDEFNYSGLPKQLEHTPIVSKAMLMDAFDDMSPSVSPKFKADPQLSYTGPTYTLNQLEDAKKKITAYIEDYTSPFTGETLDAPINRSSNIVQIQDIVDAVKRGHSFEDAMKRYAGFHMQRMMGGSVKSDAKHAARSRWDDYRLPTGKDYTETLLTEPIGMGTTPETRRLYELESKLADNMKRVFNGKNEPLLPEEEFDELENLRSALGLDFNKPLLKQAEKRVDLFKHEHWDDTPNVTAHIRATTRDMDGVGPTHFIDEIQSDWHQAGRKYGYRGSAKADAMAREKAGVEDVLDKAQHVVDEASRSYEAGIAAEKLTGIPYKDALKAISELPGIVERYNSGLAKVVPNSPFADSWQDLALKRALYDAAASGSPGIAWTLGEDATAIVGGKLKGQKKFYDEELPSRIRKLLATKGQKNVKEKLLELAEFNDPKNSKIVDDFINDSRFNFFPDPEGVAGENEGFDEIVNFGNADDPWPKPATGPTGVGHYIPIDPQTRARILAEGFPLLSLPFLAAFGLTGGDQRAVQ